MANNNEILPVPAKSLRDSLTELPGDMQELLIDRLDPARIISTLEFKNLIEKHSPQQFKSIKKVAVVSGGHNEPELYFLNPKTEIECLRFEQDNLKWDLMKDWGAEEYRKYQNKFDLVLCEQVLEHVHSPVTAVANLYRITKPNGLIHISVPGINGEHGSPHYFYAGFHPRVFKHWLSKMDADIVASNYWGSQKAAKMYASCDWAPLRISGGRSFFLHRLKRIFKTKAERFGYRHVKAFIQHSCRYSFESIWDYSNPTPVISWCLIRKNSAFPTT